MKKRRKSRSINGVEAQVRTGGDPVDKMLAKKIKSPGIRMAVRTLIDIAAAVSGAGLAAAIGKKGGILTGTGILIAGNVFKDPTGISRIVGVSATAYSIAKALQDKSLSGAEDTSTVKERLSNFLNELKAAYYIDRLLPDKKESTQTSVSGFGEIDFDETELDLSRLDAFDNLALQQAKQSGQVAGMDDFDSPNLEFAYNFFDDLGDD